MPLDQCEPHDNNRLSYRGEKRIESVITSTHRASSTAKDRENSEMSRWKVGSGRRLQLAMREGM